MLASLLVQRRAFRLSLKRTKPLSPETSNAIRIFFSYAHEDEPLRDELAKHLSLMKRRGLIEEWHDRQIVAGEVWASQVDEYLNTSHVILLLISADFLSSDYCYGVEMERALERHKAADDACVVIPIILRAVDDWASTPFSSLQLLPKDGKPVTSWSNIDEAFANVVGGIRLAIEKLRRTRSPQIERVKEKAGLPGSTAPKVSIKPPASFWTDLDPHYSGFHKAERDSATYRPDILLVFVCGGSTTPTWDGLPGKVLEAARLDLDVLAVEYAGDKLTAERLGAFAADLRMLFATTFAVYRHILFVAQNGDLIVKQMLLDDAAQMPGSATVRDLHDSSLTCRCRSIVSVSTPDHDHGAELAEAIGDAFEKHLQQYDLDALPTPAVLPFPPTSLRRPESETLRPRDTRAHENSPPSSLPGPLTAYLAERLSPFRSYRAAVIARQTISRSCALDPQVRRLFGNEQLSAKPAEVLPSGHSQAGLLNRLLETARSPAAQALCVITGTAGMGKSVLLRVVARRLATIRLRGVARASLPLFFPLSQFKLDASGPDPENVWRLLSERWGAWVSDLLVSEANEEEVHRPELISIDQTWIQEQLRRSPTTLILDSVDEFMLNHPHLSLTDFASLLRFLQTEFSENSQLLIIVAIRTSARDVTLITESESQVLTLRGMAVSEASAIFPSAMSSVGHASDAAVQRLMLTPLILSALEKSDLELKPEAYLNRAALIHAALGAIIASMKRAWTGKPYSTSNWINALSLVAWLQYRDLRGDIDDQHVADFAASVVEAWSNGPRSAARMDVVAGFSILLNPQSRKMLLRHSIYFPIGEDAYRLKHKEWGDYLVSHYAVLCIRHGQFDDLSFRALNHDIYIMAGQQLQEIDVDQRNVRALVERSSTDGRFLILGNFAQMLGASFAPIAGDVLDQEILAKLPPFPGVVRFAMLSALSSRILLDDPRDTWHEHMRSVLLKALIKHAGNESENALVRSMSWCFLRALTRTKTPWPGLWQNEEESIDSLSMIATLKEDQFVVNDRQRSIQAAFMRIQYYALEIPSRVISTIHYLYPLALGYSRQMSLDRTVVAELPSLLSDQRLDAAYTNYPVPEITAIWKRCKELYEEATVGTPSIGNSK